MDNSEPKVVKQAANDEPKKLKRYEFWIIIIIVNIMSSLEHLSISTII